MSRDRGDYYIKGASAGAPQAVQVADRWHLLHNLQEALVRLVDRFPQQLKSAGNSVVRVAVNPSATELPPTLPGVAENPLRQEVRPNPLTAARRARRFERYQQAIKLHQQKLSDREIARQLHMHRETVGRWVRAGSFPERMTRRRKHGLTDWHSYLERRWSEGCRNAARLTSELSEQGFQGSYHMVRRYLACWRTLAGGDCPKVATVPRISPKSMAWWLLKASDELTGEQQQWVREFCNLCSAAEVASKLAHRFAEMVRERRVADLQAWLTQAADADSPPEMRRFAAGLKDDLSAVKAALSLPWSNGQTEGQVNRLKLVKRQMYGRANFDLLRCRFLATGS